MGPTGVVAELGERGIARQTAESLLTLLHADHSADDGAVLTTLRPRLDDSGQAAIATLLELKALLAKTPAGPYVRLSPELARGLSYYTGPIFEINVADLSGSIGGGGRYDHLIGMFGSAQVPAVGCSLGLERILLVMEERQMYPPLRIGPDALLCWLDVGLDIVLAVAQTLRGQGLRVEIYPESAKLGKQLQYADSAGVNAPLAAIVGTSEASAGTVVLKHLASGEQLSVPLAEAGECARRLLGVETRRDCPRHTYRPLSPHRNASTYSAVCRRSESPRASNSDYAVSAESVVTR